MKPGILSLLILMITAQSCSAGCDAERREYESQQAACDTWIKVTKGIGSAGMIGGACTGGWGFLLGASGAVPGTVAYFVCESAKSDHRKLAACEGQEALRKFEEEQKAKDREITEKSKTASLAVANYFCGMLQRCEKQCGEEIAQLINKKAVERTKRFISQGGNPADEKEIRRIHEEITRELDDEIEKIKRKYF